MRRAAIGAFKPMADFDSALDHAQAGLTLSVLRRYGVHLQDDGHPVGDHHSEILALQLAAVDNGTNRTVTASPIGSRKPGSAPPVSNGDARARSDEATSACLQPRVAEPDSRAGTGRVRVPRCAARRDLAAPPQRHPGRAARAGPPSRSTATAAGSHRHRVAVLKSGLAQISALLRGRYPRFLAATNMEKEPPVKTIAPVGLSADTQ